MTAMSRATAIAIALCSVSSLVLGGVASAQEPPPAEPAPVAAEPVALAAPMAPGEHMDGPRFRFGISGGGGGEFVSGLSAWLVGFDLRLGVQINDLIGIYVQPHLSFGDFGGSGGGLSGSTATFATTVNAEVTLFDHLFAGAGFGYAILNNPGGPALALRIGAYPVAVRPDPMTPRRKGLSIGLDFRAVFLGGVYDTATQVMVSIGYEAF